MAKTLKFGGGTWATKKGSTLAYSDEGGNFKPLPFTYTGAGKGTRVNKQGLIEVVENDRPRIDYLDSEDGVFLLEKAATNSVTYSEDFSDGDWSKISITVDSNQVTSPDGTQNADKLTKSASNSLIRQFITTSGANTFSAYVKKGSLSWVRLYIASSTESAECWFDLENGLTGKTSGNPDSVEIIDVNNGWYRCIITKNTTNINNFRIYPSQADDDTSGTSGYIYSWGAQVESGNVASSYIPTQGNPQTRVQETASGSGNSEVFNDSEGVFYINTAALSNDGTNRQIAISDGNTSQRVYFGFRSNSNEFLLSSRDSSYIVTTIGDVTNFNKYAFQYKSGNFKAFINGFNYTLNADGGLLPTGLNTLNFNDGAGGADYFGKTKEISYYDEILTDLELETLTSYRTWEAMVKELNLNIIHNE